MGIYLLSSVNFIIYSLQIPSLNINIVTKQHGSHHYHLPFHIKPISKSNRLHSAEKNMNSKMFVSRSFSSNFTMSDHKPVIAKIQIKWTYMKKATGTRSFNLSKLQSTQVAENYTKQVNKIMKNQTSKTSNQEEWNNIKTLKTSAERNLGYNHQEIKSRD